MLRVVGDGKPLDSCTLIPKEEASPRKLLVQWIQVSLRLLYQQL